MITKKQINLISNVFRILALVLFIVFLAVK